MSDLIELKKQGLSTQAISVPSGRDRKVVRKYLAGGEAVPENGTRVPRPRKLDRFNP